MSDTTIAAMPISSAMSFQFVDFNDLLLVSPVSTLGHKPSFYPRFPDRLLCGVKQPLSQLPRDRLSSARGGQSSDLLYHLRVEPSGNQK